METGAAPVSSFLLRQVLKPSIHLVICSSLCRVLNHPSISTTSGESGELGRAINLDLKEAAEETTGDKPEYDLYRIWKEHLTPVSIFVCLSFLFSPPVL